GRSDIYSLGATLYCALTDALPEDGLERAMNHIELTPIRKRNPKVSDNVAQIIEKCLSVKPEDRYQTADELRFALMEARSVSKKKLPLELVLQPPMITIHDHLPELVGERAQKNRIENGTDVDRKSTRPLQNGSGEIEILTGGVKSRRRASAWFLLTILPVILLIAILTYIARPELAREALALLLPAVVPSSTPTLQLPSDTVIPILASETASPTTLSPATPTETASPNPTLTSTFAPTPTITLTPLPTPLGGSGQIAFASTRSGAVEIWLMNIDGTGLIQVTNIPEGACQPNWSPDGTQLVFISPCIGGGMIKYPGSSLFIINADGSGLTPLPSAPGGDYDPHWSPDGTLIAFTSLRNGGVPGIFILNLIDNSLKSLVENESRAISQPAWSPNGVEIAYVNSDNRIWVMDANGGNRRDLIAGGGDFRVNGPAWSPDGSVVIYTQSVISDTTGTTELMAVPYTITGAQPVEVANSQLVADVSYSSDGYWLLFTSWFSGFHDIYLMRANGVDRHPVLQDPAYDSDPTWRPRIMTQP
ncbi:MAG TPA: hypothetical protein VLD65_00900, partial [Anaerolineales bacterium]|nr:hypothetical protein [Anaerolineales bacterium]